MSEIATGEQIKGVVRETYGQIARRYREESSPSTGRVVTNCCDRGQAASSDCCAPDQALPSDCCRPAEEANAGASRFYSGEELTGLPDSVTGMSLGCGNPTAIAELQPGETVLDLGSGGGIDCFLAARQVGPQGRVIGLDMTPDMIKLARRNAKKIGASNVDFRYGEMEEMPLPDGSVDVIISNCVINLSPDKDAVFREAYRVLGPGGRMSVSDIVVNGDLPAAIRDNLNAWAGCIAGALDESDYLDKIAGAGFEGVQVASRDYVKFSEAAEAEDVRLLLQGTGLRAGDLDNRVASIKVKARKPQVPA
jgi:arsenite methyltransferase